MTNCRVTKHSNVECLKISSKNVSRLHCTIQERVPLQSTLKSIHEDPCNCFTLSQSLNTQYRSRVNMRYGVLRCRGAIMLKSLPRSSFRSAASQLCGIFPYFCLKFAYGSITGFQIILLAELYKKDSEIKMSLDQLTSLAGVTVLTPVGILGVGLLAQRLGSRTLALASATVYIIFGLLYCYSTDATMIFVAQVLSKLTGTNALTDPHISEVSEPHRRSAFLVIAHLCMAVGTFFALLLDSLVYWRTVALVNLVCPLVAALTLLATPNSPTWLASKGRLDEAEKSLSWLRGWVHPNEVQTEFHALVDSVGNLNSSSEHRKLGWQARSRAFLQLFLKRSFYLPLGTVCMAFLLHELDGVKVVHSYSKIVFQKIDSPIDASLAIVVLEAIRILGNFTILLVLRRTGKRKLIFFTVAVTAVCHVSVAIVQFSKLRNNYLWIPPIAVIIANFASTAGLGTIAYMLLSEIFPSSLRYVGMSIGLSFDSIVISLVNKSFLYVVEAISLPGTFLAFALMNVVALLAYHFLLPETEGRSLTEIKDYFRDKRKEPTVHALSNSKNGVQKKLGMS